MADHLIQAAAAVVVLLVQLQVLGKGIDAEGQDCDLDLRRTGIALVNLILFDKSLLLFLGNHILHLWLIDSGSDVIAAGGEAFPKARGENRGAGNRNPTTAAWTLSDSIIPQTRRFVKRKTENLFVFSHKNAARGRHSFREGEEECRLSKKRRGQAVYFVNTLAR